MRLPVHVLPRLSMQGRCRPIGCNRTPSTATTRWRRQRKTWWLSPARSGALATSLGQAGRRPGLLMIKHSNAGLTELDPTFFGADSRATNVRFRG